FLSYSGTSLVMALAAFGIVISISRHRGSRAALKSFVVQPATDKSKESSTTIEAKSLTRNLIAGMLLFFTGAVVMLSITGYYQLCVREKIIIHPSITATDKGLTVLSYNPRIRQVIDMLDRGNLYDRNGVLLATSDKKELLNLQDELYKAGVDPGHMDWLTGKHLKRYYPFGDDLVFMVGDINRPDVYANYGFTPMGYLAENANEEMLRGFETKPKTVELTSERYKYNKFLDPASQVILKYQLHDYSSLLPALSEPVYRNKFIEEFNASRNKRDVHLAVDARLQTELQRNLANYIESHELLSTYPQLRASVVVMDAGNGELLTSSNYPLPNTDSIVNIRELNLDTKGGAPSEWRPGKPVTERDLGLTYQTAPGSTAKVMSALAAFKKLGAAAYDMGYIIKPYMTIEPPTSEPNTDYREHFNRNGGMETYMEDAIKYSSNCYFVMIVDEEDLYTDLADIYWAVGATLSNRKPYFFSTAERTQEGRSLFNKTMSTFRTNGLKDYNRYKTHKPASETWDTKSKDRMSSIQAYTGIAWGQSQLDASPLNMARVAAIVANGGKLMPTQFLVGHKDGEVIEVIDKASADKLASAMQAEASKWIDKNIFPSELTGKIGGKTGTPMRAMRGSKLMNDAWYICFIKNATTGRTLCAALRLERLPHGERSEHAVDAMAEVVIPTLKATDYIMSVSNK
ncbi:MAG: penicillin-binding transpeptidase domain-containing protein, partial [Lachnospiraceae bacterium]|nr:penicillin-binding transpeptidase domain-containing protein [Lachnospiraceae bacterium]